MNDALLVQVLDSLQHLSKIFPRTFFRELAIIDNFVKKFAPGNAKYEKLEEILMSNSSKTIYNVFSVSNTSSIPII